MSERRRGSNCSNPEAAAAGGAAAGEAITVGVRLRPLLPHEKGQKPILKIIGDKVVSVVEGAGVKYTGPSSFQFDYAMDSTDASSPSYVGAAKCYDLMGRRMLEHMMLGYSTCLFCYGQTGTGKTTTIMGKPSPVEEQGILLRLITELFAEVARLQAEGYEATVQLQMLEVYNEKISDLLVPRNKSNSPGGDNKKVDVHVHPDIGVYLTGATELTVEKADKCAQWIEFGNSMKTVHATAMNSQSSRGHTVVKINVERKGGPDGTVLRSEVYFADLAGRENEKTTQVQGDRLIELTFINRSLLQLANCIQTLGKAGMAARRKTTMKPQAPSPPDGAPEDSPPPPSKKGKDMSKFRNSKLTLLLSNALSGNSRTAMIGTLSPAIGNFEESYSTLRFAVTVGAIKVEATKTTEQDYPALVKKLQGEVAELRSQLSEAKANVFTDHGIKLVETEVRAREELVDRLTKDPKVARRESKTHEHLMQDVMRQYGIKEFSEVPFPRLVNCSDDSGEIGKMLYHIPDDDVEHPLGSDDSNDFRLPPRTGVLPRMCTLRNDGQHVWIRLARPAEDKEHPKAADVRIDGVPLGPEEARVGHLSCLHFGPATAFYVCTEQVSKEELFRRWSEPPTNASAEELMSLILGDGRDEQREQIGQAAKRYLGDICKAQKPESMKSFLKQARDARSMVTRANSITEEVRPGSGLRFELVAHAPVLPPPGPGPPMPELGVRLVRAWGEESGPPSPSFGLDAPPRRPSAELRADAPWSGRAEGYEVLSTWSVEKMADRLELMERPSDYVVDDPWAEYGLGEVQELRNDYEDRLRDAHEEQRLLRHEIHQLRRRLLGQIAGADGAAPGPERAGGGCPEPEPEGGRLETATRLLDMAERNRSLVRQILAFQQTGSLLEAKAPGRGLLVRPALKRAAFGGAASGRPAQSPAGRPQRSHLDRSVTLENPDAANDCESHLSRHTRQRGKGRPTHEKIEHAIEQDSICANLEQAERAQIIESMKYLTFEDGDLIVMQGKPGNTFFAIHEGKADVFIDGQAINTLSEGSAFGGLALVCACPRTATLRASGRCAVWAAHGDVFRDVLRKHAKKRLAENRKFIDCMHMFDGLQPRQKDRLGDLFFTKVFEGGKQVLQEGGSVAAIYFVKRGSLSCRSLVPGARASRQLGPGDCFGEQALVESTKPDEIVETLERCELLGISVEALKEALGADVGPKLQREFIMRGFRSSPAFSLFSSTQHQAMIEEIAFKDYAPGSLIDSGLRCGVVISGAVTGGGPSAVRLGRGGWFEDGSYVSRPGDGQESMLRRQQSASSAYVVMGGEESGTLQDTEVEDLAAAPEGARVGQLSSASFAAVLQRMGLLGVGGGTTDAVSFTRRLELLKRVHIFRHLSRVQMSGLANSFSVQGYQKGAFVIREEEVGRQFFVIANGEVQVKIKGERIRAIGKHGTFGERSLLFHERRTASVEVSSSSAELLVLGIGVFSQIVRGKMQEIMMHRIRLQDTSASLKDLAQVRVIGVGGMGVVRLVEHKDTRTRYALKRIRKAKDGSTPPQVISECELLKEMDHPFVMAVVQTYDTPRSTYILTELLTGGELFRVLHPPYGDQVCLTRSQAQFYAGSILLVLEALFDRSIVYRDLKPENVMLDFQGYIKIIDFGISKKLDEGSARTFSVIGTPEYMAPEAFTSKGYGFEVDIWSLGVVIFELLCGRVPFGAGVSSQQEVVAAVRNSPLNFPASLDDPSARALLEGLLERRPEKRLGAGMNGYDEIKQAEFFAIGDENSSLFDKIMGRELEPPVVPEEETYCDDDEAEEQVLSDAEELASS